MSMIQGRGGGVGLFPIQILIVRLVVTART